MREGLRYNNALGLLYNLLLKASHLEEVQTEGCVFTSANDRSMVHTVFAQVWVQTFRDRSPERDGLWAAIFTGQRHDLIPKACPSFIKV